MNVGLSLMALLTLLPVGVLQLDAALTHGTGTRARRSSSASR
jgi:nitric oxide reductase large subunit